MVCAPGRWIAFFYACLLRNVKFTPVYATGNAAVNQAKVFSAQVCNLRRSIPLPLSEIMIFKLGPKLCRFTFTSGRPLGEGERAIRQGERNNK